MYIIYIYTKIQILLDILEVEEPSNGYRYWCVCYYSVRYIRILVHTHCTTHNDTSSQSTFSPFLAPTR